MYIGCFNAENINGTEETSLMFEEDNTPRKCVDACLSIGRFNQWSLNWSRGYKTFFSCSTQLSLKFILFINVKMPTTVGILTFLSGIYYQFLRFEPEFSTNSDYFSIYEQLKFHAQLS